MVKTPRKTGKVAPTPRPEEEPKEVVAKKTGPRPKPKEELKDVVVTLKFNYEQAQIIKRAAARKFDDRAPWCRKLILETAYKELGLPLPGPEQPDPAALALKQKK